MLGKLIKYEFRATGRTLGPLYGALLALTLIVKFQIVYSSNRGQGLIPSEHLGQIIGVMTTLLYVAIIAAIFVMTLILLIQRFYKNLLGAEGYLMFTLPVSVNQLIVSKLVVALVWTLVSGIAAILSICILGMDSYAWANLFSALQRYLPEVWRVLGGHGILLTVEILLLMVVSTLQSILHIYAAIALGHLAKRRRGLASVGGYIGLSAASTMVMQVIGMVLVWVFHHHEVQIWWNTVTRGFMGGVQLTESILLALLLACALFGAAFYAITHVILHRRLNLE